MTDRISLDDVVFNSDVYPRSSPDAGTVDRYSEAMQEGATFPPLILERDTNILLDGWHRCKAAQQIGVKELAADWHTVPNGMHPKLYAASLSVRHGLVIPTSDLRGLARELYEHDEQLDIAEVARALGRARETVRNWVQDIADERQATEERKREITGVSTALLRELDWTWPQIGKLFGLSKDAVARAGQSAVSRDLDPAVLKAALGLIPQDARPNAEAVADRWRQERIFAKWSPEERELRDRLLSGETIVVNMRTGVHEGLIAWAESESLYQRIDRRSEYGNPFEINKDGDRDTVIQKYAKHYVPHKGFLGYIHELRGKALGCWCAPDHCHGHVLRWLAEADGDQAPTLDQELPVILEAADVLSAEEFAAHAAGEQ